MHDDQFKMLLSHLQLSWEGYLRVRKGVKKRVARHMRASGCGRKMQDYLDAVDHDPQLKRECERLLAVNISRFLRDRPMWTALQQWLHRRLTHCTSPVLRVWVAGCACGEEAYSFKMLWEEMALAPSDKPRLSLLATDMNPEVLDRARAGRYPLSSLREVSPLCREAYFHPPDSRRHCRVRQWLKAGIVWQRHDFRHAPPGNGYHLLFLRNSVLTYYAGSRRDDALMRLLGALGPGGALIVGAKETVPARCMGPLQPGPHRSIWVHPK